MKKTLKRILCGVLSLVSVSSIVLERALANADGKNSTTITSTDVSFKNVTGQYDTSALMQSYLNTSVMKAEDTAPKYETRSVIVTLSGKNMVDRANGENVLDYLSTWGGNLASADIADEQDAFLSALKKKGISYKLERRYSNVLNGVAIEIDTKYVSDIKKMKGVESVVITTAYAEPKTVETVSDGDNVVTNETSVYETGIYNSDGYEAYGAGTVVAVLDTGLDYTHPAFQDFATDNGRNNAAWDKDYVKNVLNDKDMIAEQRSGSLDVSDVYVSAKVPFAYDYADDDPDVYPSYSNHGTHVAGIIGGYDTNGYTDKDGNPIDKTFKGVVPDSQLVICKVFTDDLDDPDLGGAVAPDIVAALDDCVMLNVDVINMSLGTSCGFTTTNDGDDEGEMLNRVYESIKEAGISLVCAASNDYSAGYGGVYGTNLASNPDSGTVGSPSTFAASLSVASVNGQKASYMVANENTENKAFVFFEESRDIDGNPFDFVKDLQKAYPGKSEFEYVVIPGNGQAADYDSKVRALLKEEGKPRIALIKRGDSTFQEKVEIAMQLGAAGVIIYNNVAGVIRMNLGEIENPVPSVSINMNAGNAMVAGAVNRVGTIRLDENLKAGPFMSEFSSWGPTHDLKLKPEITAHGGEITSTVPGGYGEQSGTSMASPNMAGFTALVRSYLKTDLGIIDPVEINRLAMQMIMSTATTAYDQDGLPYSPRKQGAGIARMERVIGGTNAYLWTENAENDNRPKLELGDDDDKTGVYTMSFKVTNFGATELKFSTDQLIMTETLSSDKLTVSEQARMLDKAKTVWTVGGQQVSEITVGAETTVTVNVQITLDESEKKYIDDCFENGMYVEGFLKLNSATAGQCDLSIPFLAFYGDWEAAPMLDYTAFEVAQSKQDASVKEEDKIKASVWETLPYTSYYNETYILPMGGYVYLLPDDAEPMYVDEAKCSVSRYNIYYGNGNAENYTTSTAIKAVYAGLLRNARVVKYRLYSEETGELILEDVCNRIGKAYAGGGQGTPANVELELSPEAEGLMANGKYRMEFDFFMDTPAEGEKAKEENTYQFTFTVDYEAPILEDVRVRYYNYKDGKKEKQRIYLDVDVYDNHYAQALMLCYPQKDAQGDLSLMLATDYPTPIRNANPNGTTTVSIEITDIYEKYGSQFYLQVDDYAINSCLYQVDINAANRAPLKDVKDFTIVTDTDLTLDKNNYKLTVDQYEAYKVKLNFAGEGDASNFVWSSTNDCVAVKNGEIVGLKAGTAEVIVSTGKGTPKFIEVTVTDQKNTALVNVPSISFGVIKTNQDALAKATGMVKVNVGEEILLPVETDPWYHPMTDLRLVWNSTDPSVATVEDGKVTTLKKGTTSITASVERKKADGSWESTLYSTSVTLRVQNEFTVSNYTLSAYKGTGYNAWLCPDCGEAWAPSELKSAQAEGGTEFLINLCPDCGVECNKSTDILKIPTDMNIWYIGAEAFKENNNIKKIIIPKSVTQISEYAFMNCTALEEVYFVSLNHRENGGTVNQKIDWADISMIYEYAFYGCPNLKKLDFSNVKTVTVAHYAFADCTSLSEVVDMPSIGTMHHYAFANTALETVDLTGLYMSGNYVFAGCKNLSSVEIGKFTAIGNYMFQDCTALRDEIIICTTKVGAGAFLGCINLEGVKFDSGKTLAFEIGAEAFKNCGTNLKGANFTVDFNGENIRVIGDRAFAGSSLVALDALKGLEVWGTDIFAGTSITTIAINDDMDIENLRFAGVPFAGMTLVLETGSAKYVQENGVLYNAEKTKLLHVNPTVTALTVEDTVTEIGAYAFAGSNVESVTLSANVTKIGAGAFEKSGLSSIHFNGATLTEIPDNAFKSSRLSFVALPESVTKIGAYAFAESALSNFTANGVTTIGNNAFENCTALRGAENNDNKYVLTLGENVKTLGNNVFRGCTDLTSVAMPAVESMGRYTFGDLKNLKEAAFADGAKTIGAYTFYNSGIETVTLGDGLTKIANGAFYGCADLTAVTLPETVVEIGEAAFQNCRNLTTVNVNQIVTFGAKAFYGTGIADLDLQSAKTIGEFAFGTQTGRMAYTEINIPVAESIGNFAFFGGSESEVVLPSTLTKIGYGAFANSKNLTTFTVENNAQYFVENGVLYRVIDKDAGEYEVICYPAAYEAENKALTVKAGTLRVDSYAFYGLKNGVLEKVTLPYTLNTIGDSAFYASGIKEYTFESIQAPTLEAVYRQEIADKIEGIVTELNGAAYYKGYYNTNFETEVYNFTKYVRETSTLTMNYPSNGNGYDNHIYELYFSTRNAIGILAEDDTRTCIDIIDSLPSVTDINAWAQLDKTDANKAMVEEWSEKVKTARLYLNNAKNKEGQIDFITDARVATLESVENALRSVKDYFGIKVKLVELRVASNSAHKSEYKEGDTFDMTGLVVEMIYDDYSVQTASGSQLSLKTTNALSSLTRYVVVTCNGKDVRVSVTVEKTVVDTPDAEDSASDSVEDSADSSVDTSSDVTESGCKGIGIVIAVILVLVAGGAAFAVLYWKKKTENKAETQVIEVKESNEEAEEIEVELTETETQEIEAEEGNEETEEIVAEPAETETQEIEAEESNEESQEPEAESTETEPQENEEQGDEEK